MCKTHQSDNLTHVFSPIAMLDEKASTLFKPPHLLTVTTAADVSDIEGILHSAAGLPNGNHKTRGAVGYWTTQSRQEPGA